MRAGFATGALLAVVASRVLPPMVGRMTGTARVAAGRDPFDALADDHRQLLSLLTSLAEGAADGAFMNTQRLLRLKRRMAAHALAEEDVVYPVLFEHERQEHARRLYAEHAEMKVHLHALEEMAKEGPAFADRVRRLHDLVESHGGEEERDVFPLLRDRLDRQALARLSGQVQREKSFIL